MASCPSTCSSSNSRVVESNVIHLPETPPTQIVSPIGEKQHDCTCSPMSLLHTTECDSESHICSKRSRPPVTKCGSVGCVARPQSSSVCPMTTGESPNSKDPVRMQLRVVPTRSCVPRPSETTRIPPKWGSMAAWAPKTLRSASNRTRRPSLPPPDTIPPSLRAQREKIEPSWTRLINLAIVLVPLPQTMTFPFESPVTVSPLAVKVIHVTYLGLSRPSNTPMRLYSAPP
uniref:Uncharacterized protein n=1 Tax=Lutzomyia longipalpis TaxID=7200 RepID=A0A7G3B1K5_LUTLO